MKKSISGLMVCMMATLAHGDGDALFKQGTAVFKSEPEKAYSLFKQAAGEGNVSAMVGTGHCLENGIGTEIDHALAIAWYEKAVAQNNLKACEGLARIYASCPDPQFHDGEKAVQYTEALARKNQRDPDTLSLLAAAHARNMDFEQAVRFAEKAVGFERSADAMIERRKLRDAYKQGMPNPAIATQAWMLETLDKSSLWAFDCMLWRVADSTSSMYDHDKAIRACEFWIESGYERYNWELGTIYLRAGKLEEAGECYKKYLRLDAEVRGSCPAYISVDGYSDLDAGRILEQVDREQKGSWSGVNVQGTERLPGGSTRDVYQVFNTLEEAEKKYPYPSEVYDVKIVAHGSLPNMARAELLLLIAAAKESREAKKQLSVMEQQKRETWRLLDDGEGSSNFARAEGLISEALKYCDNDVLPINLPLAALCLETSYELKPSVRTAYILGCFYLRDHMLSLHYDVRACDKAVRWLVIAHAGGDHRATQRLIEFYACDQEESNWNAELALKYAEGYVDACSPNDSEASRLLACAYARNGQFRDAIRIVQKALERNPGNGKLLGMVKRFEDEKPEKHYFGAILTGTSYKNVEIADWRNVQQFADWVNSFDEE